VFSVKRLFNESKQESPRPQFTFSDIAKHASKKAQRHERKKNKIILIELPNYFGHNVNKYRIEKVREYRYDRFNTARSEWKVVGNVDIFQMHNVIAN